MSTSPKPNTCPICKSDIAVTGTDLFGDQPCPECGKKLWFLTAANEARFFDFDESAELREKTYNFIAERFEVERENVTPDMLDNLDVDSLEALEMLMDLEEELGLVD